MIIIPIGCRCNIAQNLERSELRKETNIFDWDFTCSLSTINEILKCDDAKRKYRRFTDYTTETVDEYFGAGKDVQNLILVNTVFNGLIFRHFDLNKPKHQLTYDRRIDRLTNHLKSDEPIVFIRQLHNGNIYKRLDKCGIDLPFSLDDTDTSQLDNMISSFFSILYTKYNRVNDYLFLLSDENIDYLPIQPRVEIFNNWEELLPHLKQLITHTDNI